MVVPKFRAWDTFDEDMVNDIFFSWQDCGYDSLNECLSDERWKFMQFTGLVDKNGKEIWEGDVVLENGWRKVAVSFGTQEIEENFGDKRIFQGFNLYLGGGYPEAVMSKHEIIGNIYENPELVEVLND
ncbi:YopX protein [Streptococcus suis]|uniref:YopX family protein n=2 Tax=Streptococcus suis TaxID=1307 RepID=UPI0002B786E3|nr:YopX family protein [Streptococcus suis]AGF87672.1 putative YopX protein [Streptococcus phage phiS10]MDG3160132.1 YopX family protein [Streptococcus suis]MDG3223413.1 YopX family protein [Streptococcus suis]MDG3240657.1 YopX family protein [Streptococcus suis]MDN2973152.1 YopX family protein [Streptococcus suis]